MVTMLPGSFNCSFAAPREALKRGVAEVEAAAVVVGAASWCSSKVRAWRSREDGCLQETSSGTWG